MVGKNKYFDEYSDVGKHNNSEGYFVAAKTNISETNLTNKYNYFWFDIEQKFKVSIPF